MMMLGLSLLLLLFPHPARSVLLGWVESPGYPSGYSPHASLNWSKCASEGRTLSIQLIHLDLEDSRDCENDAVKIFSDGNLIVALCGNKEFKELQSSVNPLLVSASGGCLSVSFQSDDSNEQNPWGFRGFYSEQDYDECGNDQDKRCTQVCHNVVGGYECLCYDGYKLEADKHTCTVSCSEDLSGRNQGVISSPSWPGSYGENASCQYTLSVEAHLQLELHFSDAFDVERSSDGQCIDALRIETPYGTLGPFCGQTPPPSPFLTHSHQVKVHFTSDGFGTNKGFTFRFQTRALDCSFPDIPEDGSIKVVGSDNSHTLDRHQIQFSCSKYYTLEGDDTYTCNDTGDWVSNGGNTEMPKCTRICGMPEKNPSAGRILGGRNAKLGELPWQLLIKEPSRGGATLINERWAVTSAYVVEGVEETSLNLYGGLIDGRTIGASTSDVVTLQSEKIIIHPGYRNVAVGDRTSYDNDIALIRFTSRVNFEPNLLPICLPDVNSNLEENEQGTVSGWGFTESRKDNITLVTAQLLKYAHIGVYSLRECRDTPLNYAKMKPMIFTDNMFCAGAPGKNSCQRDNGGPFVSPMLSSGGGPYHLTGIVSWGPPCNERRYKGYYTKVKNYLNWIHETINNVEAS